MMQTWEQLNKQSGKLARMVLTAMVGILCVMFATASTANALGPCGNGTVTSPFTSMQCARGLVTSEGVYYFTINTHSFSTVVSPGGWVLLASGSAATIESIYPQTSSLNFGTDTILTQAIVQSLTETSEIRINAPSGPNIPFDVTTVSPNAITNLLNYEQLNTFPGQTIVWSGTGSGRMITTCQGVTQSLDRVVYHACGNTTGLHWVVGVGAQMELVSYTGGRNDLNLWVRAPADVTPPAAPAAPDLLASSDTGRSNTDNISNALPWIFSVVCSEVGSTIQLYANGIPAAAGHECTSIGPELVTTSALPVAADGLHDGLYSMTYTEADPVGNVSPVSPSLAVTLDSQAPLVTAADCSLAPQPVREGQTVTLTCIHVESDAIVTAPNMACTPTPATASSVVTCTGTAGYAASNVHLGQAIILSIVDIAGNIATLATDPIEVYVAPTNTPSSVPSAPNTGVQRASSQTDILVITIIVLSLLYIMLRTPSWLRR